MKTVESIKEYSELLGAVKERHKRAYSNLFLSAEEAENYIVQNRLEYEECVGGILFFLDEALYYKLFINAALTPELTIPKRDKDLCFRNVYRKEADPLVEEVMKNCGFIMDGTSVEIQGDPHELIAGMEKIGKYKAFMERKGYRCVIPSSNIYSGIEDMIQSTGILRKYHYEYRTPEEKESLIPGSYLCMEKDGRICAAGIATISNGTAHMEDLVIAEEDKLKGLAPIMTYVRMEWLIEHGINVARGWILMHNEESIRYHRSLGYRFTNKYADEWIREDGNVSAP